MLSETALRALDFYGGRERWENCSRIQAIVNAGGLAFHIKHRPLFREALVELEVHKPYCKITPVGRSAGITGVLDGHKVRLEDHADSVIAARSNPRAFFGGRRLLYWDDLDMTYFASYAFWNYFTLPNLLLNSSIVWIEKVPGVLLAYFPETIPTHCYAQEFHFDISSGQLLRHNYTVDIISRYARVANEVVAHGSYDGIPYVSERMVSPAKSQGMPLGWPTMIHIQVLDYAMTSSDRHKRSIL